MVQHRRGTANDRAVPLLVFAAHVRPENLSVSYLAEDERQTKKGDGFMDIRKKTRVFRTSDGFTLTRKVAVWTDGDLTFEDYCQEEKARRVSHDRSGPFCLRKR